VATDQHVLRTAADQALFRTLNERVKELNEMFDVVLPMGDWVCECGDLGCIERIELTLGEYAAVRRNPSWFALAPGHEHSDTERVIERNARYTIVEKTGEAAAYAAGEAAAR
jgi:hypothetical protein